MATRAALATVLVVALCWHVTSIAAAAAPPNAERLPDGLSLVALVDGEWRVLISAEGAFAPVADVDHPRDVTYHHATRRLAWVGPDARLRWRDLASGATALLGGEDAVERHTQPSWAPDGTRLLAVELPDGRSRRTRIVAFDIASGERDFLVRKRTAQFEPELSADGVLHYTTAICVDDCAGMIWELWERDLDSGRHRQLTLMNAVAKGPRLGADGWLYFTSDADGPGFHLWRVRPEPGAPPERLSSGGVRDADPVPGADGVLRFLRRTPSGAVLMGMRDGGSIELDIGVRVTDLRELEGGP